MDEVTKFQQLFQKYKDLVSKTTIRAYEVTHGEKINVQDISVQDLKAREDVEKELRKGLHFLTDNQLLELSGDPMLAEDALKIFSKRKTAF